MNHSFDIDIATYFGVNVAVLLENIAHWTNYHSLNQTNFHEGRYWVYNTHDAFLKLFPYMTPKSLRTAINKCIDHGLLIKGRFNKKKYDRTTWYSLTDRALSLYKITPNYPQKNEELSTNQNGLNTELQHETPSETRINTHLPLRADPFAPKGEPIPNIISGVEINNNIVDSNKSTSEKITDYQKDERFMRFYLSYPKKEKPRDAWKAFKSVVGKNDHLLELILEDIKKRKQNHRQWQDKQYIPLPATYLRSSDYESEIFSGHKSQSIPEKSEKSEASKISDAIYEERMRLQEEASLKKMQETMDTFNKRKSDNAHRNRL